MKHGIHKKVESHLKKAEDHGKKEREHTQAAHKLVKSISKGRKEYNKMDVKKENKKKKITYK